MARPHKCRRIGDGPACAGFKPVGVRAAQLEQVELRLDELEALRLADLEGLYHDACAEQMNVSRPTFGRLVADARRKVAAALCGGKLLVIQGGVVQMEQKRTFVCSGCGKSYEIPCGTCRPERCPDCGSTELHRAGGGSGCGRQRRNHQHEHQCTGQGHGHGHGEGQHQCRHGQRHHDASATEG